MVARKLLFALVAMVLVAPVTASAASPWAAEPTYNQQVVGKLKYGLVNTFLGWTELIQEPYQAVQHGENFFLGLGSGVVNGVGDTVLGAAHAVTFFLPQIDVPLPEGGTDIMDY